MFFHESRKGFCRDDLLVIIMDDPAEALGVRFHFLGEFVNSGRSLQYVGGRTATSHIDRDKISMPEIKGYLRDHVTVKDNWRFHWLYPGLPLYAGLSLLVNDVSCLRMSKYIKDGAFVDIYVEEPSTTGTDMSDEVQRDTVVDNEELVVLESQSCKPANKLTPKRKQKASDVVPSKRKKNEKQSLSLSVDQRVGTKLNKGKEIVPSSVPVFVPRDMTRPREMSEEDGRYKPQVEDNDSEDSDYEPNEEDSDAENSEAEEMRKYADQFKRELKAKKLGIPVEKEADFVVPEDANILDDGAISSEEGDWSYDEMSDGEGGTSFFIRKSNWPRFDSTRE